MRGLCSFLSPVPASPQKILATNNSISINKASIIPFGFLVQWFVNRGCKLVGCGSAVPKLQICNDDLSKDIETSDEWIEARTGIQRRHVFSEKESLTALAMGAAKNALQMVQVDPDDIDMILLFTRNCRGSNPQFTTGTSSARLRK